jgi:hypothetical protein
MRNGLRFGEVVIAGDAATGIIYDRYDDSCEARLDGEVIWTHPLAVVCARALARQGVHLSWSFISDKPATIAAAPQEAQAAADAAHAVAAAFGFPPYLTNAARDAAEHAHQVAAATTPAPVTLPAPLPAEPVTATERVAAGRTRCPWYGSIRRFYAVCIERGLPTDDDSVRALLGRLLGRDVPTRKTLTAADWEQAASAVKWLAA